MTSINDSAIARHSAFCREFFVFKLSRTFGKILAGTEIEFKMCTIRRT